MRIAPRLRDMVRVVDVGFYQPRCVRKRLRNLSWRKGLFWATEENTGCGRHCLVLVWVAA